MRSIPHSFQDAHHPHHGGYIILRAKIFLIQKIEQPLFTEVSNIVKSSKFQPEFYNVYTPPVGRQVGCFSKIRHLNSLPWVVVLQFRQQHMTYIFVLCVVLVLVSQV